MQRLSVDAGTSAPHRLEANVMRLVDDERSARPIPVHRAEAGREPGQTAAGVGAAVDRVQHHDHVTVGGTEAGLLGEHADSGTIQNRQRGLVGGKVAAVLTGAGPGETPVGEPVEHRSDRGSGVVECFEQGLVTHGERRR